MPVMGHHATQPGGVLGARAVEVNKPPLIATRSYTAEDLQMARRMAAVAAARCLLLPA
jgi:hypothetical protein